jgi:hypothetical protein
LQIPLQKPQAIAPLQSAVPEPPEPANIGMDISGSNLASIAQPRNVAEHYCGRTCIGMNGEWFALRPKPFDHKTRIVEPAQEIGERVEHLRAKLSTLGIIDSRDGSPAPDEQRGRLRAVRFGQHKRFRPTQSSRALAERQEARRGNAMPFQMEKQPRNAQFRRAPSPSARQAAESPEVDSRPSNLQPPHAARRQAKYHSWIADVIKL